MGSDRNTSYRDCSGRTLADYPRPSVAVDTALLTVVPGDEHLSVLQVRRANGRGWALPGTFIHPSERLVDAVKRSLRVKAGVTGTNPQQLRVFDDPHRDDRGWVLSVAHVDVVPIARLTDRSADTRLAHVDRPGQLPYGHGEIIARAVTELRAHYATEPDPAHLLAESFTVLDLRLLHEAVAGHGLQRVTFRRLMERKLNATGTRTDGTPGKPAELFRRK